MLAETSTKKTYTRKGHEQGKDESQVVKPRYSIIFNQSLSIVSPLASIDMAGSEFIINSNIYQIIKNREIKFL